MNNFIFDTLRLTDAFNTMNKYDVVNLVWKGNDKIKGLCKASKSGHGSTIFDKLNPISYEDFYQKLVIYTEQNKYTLDVYQRGLTYEELISLAQEFEENVKLLNPKISFTLENYMDYIMYVNIIQTFDGHINEVNLVNYINKYWYKDAHKASGELDSKYGIDILYKNNTRGIQVKSINFFLGNKSSTINDRKQIEPLKNKVKEKFGIDMKYAIYDRKCKQYLISSNNTPIFSFEEFNELLNANDKKHPVFNYKKITV